MALHSPHTYQEKILACGSFGCGKSTGWLQIALRSSQTRSDAEFYVLDTDGDAVERMVQANPQYRSLENLHITPAYDWDEYMDWQLKTRSVVRPQDWIVVDFIDAAWEAVQEHFTQQVFNQDIGQYFLQARQGTGMQKTRSGNDMFQPFGGEKDWQVINGLYRNFALPLLKRTRCHIYGTAQLKPIGDRDDKALKAMFGSFGVRPAGQKNLGHQFHTVLSFTSYEHQDERRYTITSFKDRERPLLKAERWSNFPSTYLVNVAGWSMTNKGGDAL